LRWGDGLPEYFSNAIECEDFRHLELDGFVGRQASMSSPAPTIALRRGQDVTIRASKADPGTSTFLSASAVSGQGLFASNDMRSAKRVFEGGKGGFALFGNLMPAKDAGARPNH
jgi:FtsP/CotA-like multicopper oxidase with cupredoxin domain